MVLYSVLLLIFFFFLMYGFIFDRTFALKLNNAIGFFLTDFFVRLYHQGDDIRVC